MITLATVFSGIGAVETALQYLNLPFTTIFACDNGERILPQLENEIRKEIKGMKQDEVRAYIKQLYELTGKENLVKQTYFANYKICESRWHEDIRFLDGTQYKNMVDLYVGGSPCQSFSVNGKRAGLNDIRGTLFYDYARIIRESKPKVFIYENVKGMLNHDNGKTWAIIKEIFHDLNYNIFLNIDENGKESPVLNSKDYGIPQNRERIFVVGFRQDLNVRRFSFPKKQILTLSVNDFLENEVESKYYLGEKGFVFVTTHPSRAQVGEPVMRCQKANQQFNWNGDFIFEPIAKIEHRKDILSRAYISKWNNKIGVIRKFTPRECLRLMGYRDDFKIIHKDEVVYRQAGNSIVVNVLMELLKQIVATGVWSIND